jgi:hypothetical protein
LPSYVPPPKTLRAFPDAWRVPAKTPMPGGGRRVRWKDPAGTIYEWDYQHGTVEMYDTRGRHLGEFDPDTGRRIKDANATRRVQP